jgi:hypothetical protein
VTQIHVEVKGSVRSADNSQRGISAVNPTWLHRLDVAGAVRTREAGMSENWILDAMLLIVAFGSVFYLMRHFIRNNNRMASVWGAVMTMALGVLLWQRMAE